MRQEGEESKLDPSSNASVRSYRFSLERLGRLLPWLIERIGEIRRDTDIYCRQEELHTPVAVVSVSETRNQIGAMHHRPRLL